MNGDERDQLAQYEWDHFHSAAPTDTFDDRPFTQDDEWITERDHTPGGITENSWTFNWVTARKGPLIKVRLKHVEIGLTPDEAVTFANSLLAEVEIRQCDQQEQEPAVSVYPLEDGEYESLLRLRGCNQAGNRHVSVDYHKTLNGHYPYYASELLAYLKGESE